MIATTTTTTIIATRTPVEMFMELVELSPLFPMSSPSLKPPSPRYGDGKEVGEGNNVAMIKKSRLLMMFGVDEVYVLRMRSRLYLGKGQRRP